MNTEFDPDKITQLLNQGTRQIDGRILSALNKARHNALERQSAHAPVFTFAPNGGRHPYADRSTIWEMLYSAQHLFIIILLVVIVVSGVGYWHHAEEQRIGELDVAILTDELPVEIFVDP